MRKLSKKTMEDLKSGMLSPILMRVQLDDTLQLAIRDNYINIYYRGGNILRLERRGSSYSAAFDDHYFISDLENTESPNTIKEKADAKRWVDEFPRLKMEMDLSPRMKNKHRLEREFQQVIARVNNRSQIANDTDYFISDIELTEKNSRFDMVSLKWLSTSPARKSGICSPAFIEVKYGDGALSGISGMLQHLEDFLQFRESENYEETIDSIENQFTQLCELGLVKCNATEKGKRIKLDSTAKPEFIFLLANHKPASSMLLDIVASDAFSKYDDVTDFEIKFAASSLMGYGLYSKNMLSRKELIAHLISD